MPTRDLYTSAPAESGWQVPMAGESRFNWEYDEGRERLLALYQKGKDKQWDAVRRIDWGLEVDPYDVLGLPDETMAIYGTPYWDKLGPANIAPSCAATTRPGSSPSSCTASRAR